MENKRRLNMLKIRNNDGQPKKDFIPYEEAKIWVRRLGFENYKQWLRFAKMRYKKGILKGRLIRPLFIPANPQCSYALRGEWISDSDFLGTTPTPKRKPGIYLPYEEAKKFAQRQHLHSMREWVKWHRRNKIKRVPRYPCFIYPEWNTWADFLGTTKIHYSKLYPNYNTFKRPALEDVIKVVQSFQLKSKNEYLQWIKENYEYFPGFPFHPDIVYDNFPGWNVFLGKTIIGKLEAQEIINDVLYIAHYPENPPNVFEISIDKKGKFNIEQKAKHYGFKVIKMYKILPEEKQIVESIITSNGLQWWEGGEDTYVIWNVHELLFQLDVLLPSL